MSKLGAVEIKVLDVSTGNTKRIIPHVIPYTDFEITEDLGKNRRTFSIECMTVGRNWEADRDRLEDELTKGGKLILNDDDLGVMYVEVTSYSINQSRLIRGVSKFSIELLEAPEVQLSLVSLDPRLSFLGKVSKVLGKIKAGIKAYYRYKGRLSGFLAEVRGAVNTVLNLPNVIGAEFADFGRMFGVLSSVVVDISAVMPVSVDGSPISDFQRQLIRSAREISLVNRMTGFIESSDVELLTADEGVAKHREIVKAYKSVTALADYPSELVEVDDLFNAYMVLWTQEIQPGLIAVSQFSTHLPIVVGFYNQSGSLDDFDAFLLHNNWDVMHSSDRSFQLKH